MLTGTLLGNQPSHAGIYLGEVTWEQAAPALENSVVVLPFAAGAKQHGRHLPLNTDQLVLEYLLAAAVQEKNVVICPPILHGWFPAFRRFPGTEVADAKVFQAYLEAVATSLVNCGAQRLVFLNMGLASTTGLPIRIVARDLRANHDTHTLVISWDDLETADADAHYEQLRGGHADEGETSILLFLKPESVLMDKAAQDYRSPGEPQIGYQPGVFAASESGTFGDPTLASAEKGEAILNIMRRNWLTAIDQFAAATSPTR